MLNTKKIIISGASILVLICQSFPLLSQDELDWDEKYKLQFSDFRSPSTQLEGGNIYSLYSGVTFDFAFQMTNAEFMFTKNFNSKVNCKFHRNAASLVAPDTIRAMDLLLFARYDFDLAELYARKVRQKAYETKGTFSNPSFFIPVFNQFQKEYSERHVQASRLTDLGQDRVKLQELHLEVLTELTAYSDFCKTCKPVKRKK